MTVLSGSTTVAAVGGGLAVTAGVFGRRPATLARRRVRRRLLGCAPRPGVGALARIGTVAERSATWFGLTSAGRSVPVTATTPMGPGVPDVGHLARLRWRGGVVVAGALVAILSAPAGLALLAIAWGVPPRLARRRAAGHRAGIERSLPAAVELLAVAAHAGLTVADAVAAVSAHVDGDVGEALAQLADAPGRGVRLVDALAQFADDLGPPARSLASVLAAAARDGDPLAPALDRLADSLQRARQQRAEIAARRLSVQLLLPLVACVLPAFALLTVVPLLLTSLRSLPR